MATFRRWCLCVRPSVYHCDDDVVPAFRIEPNQQWVRVVDVYDGDTMTCIIKLHSKYPYRFQIRLAGIDTCELRTKNPLIKAKAIQARQCVIQEVTRCSDDILQTLQTRNDIKAYFSSHPTFVWLHVLSFDKYGRVLANVYTTKPPNHAAKTTTVLHNAPSLSDILIEKQLAFEYHGRTKITEEAQCEFFSKQ